ncbi:T9SS type A sorting domain-containing protein [Ilyomonas limi]|uniref:T9SS type A sorting domain-containing protein n=1 Tax=Ilyomonas limi TaxID=2575867 RepID=A0A4U3L907_9BACT|nr:ELWxxDGT repeat protein [Ilyomonas limi]TKK71570.1 T9SS type A sorting domain-containing protein [Ilyomonas limi]
MKKPLHILLAAFSVLMFQQQSNAQVTLISNNTNITSGLVLPGNRPVLLDDDGGMWTTNGTTATKITTAVLYSDTSSAALYNNLLYFAGADATTKDVELWVTDGTAGGTKLIKNISSSGSSVPENFFVFNNTLYFTADDGSHGRELWKSNGAVGNATLVADINSGNADGVADDASFFQNGNNIYFGATSGANSGLYKIDLSGTPTLVKNIEGEIELSILYSAALGNKTVFTVRTGDFLTGTAQLWVTDGTESGTKMLKDFGFGSGTMFPQLTAYNGVLFFDGYDLTGSGIELWTTDGTPGGTKLFKDLDPSPGNSSYPTLIGSALINGKMYFGATTSANGNELWVTDGTPNGTTLFKDINTTSNGKGDASPTFLANYGAYVNSFQTENNINNFNFQQIYSTQYNGKWYFIADDGAHGIELWATDGTSGGTQMVKDINPGNNDGVEYNNLAFYTTTGIYFIGDNGDSGSEPFITDGTADGTELVADINTHNGNGSDPTYMFLFNSQIYLNADNGDNANGNTDLYKINQTVVLPVKLLNFNVALRDGGVAVNWATASEANTKNFVVERSTDAVHFSAVGTLAAAGNSNTAHQYQYNDASALQAGASTLYYRLRIIDNDGKYSYTAILSVELQGGMFKITLSPNPVHDQLTVAFSTNNAKSITLRVTDANGKQVYQQQLQTNGVTAMQQYINVSRFAAGAYFVQLITEKDTKTASFIKQ